MSGNWKVVGAGRGERSGVKFAGKDLMRFLSPFLGNTYCERDPCGENRQAGIVGASRSDLSAAVCLRRFDSGKHCRAFLRGRSPLGK